jgi:serine/threonine protein kinase
METIYINKSRVILHFRRNLFLNNTMYTTSVNNVRDLGVGVPAIRDDNDVDKFFTKLLFSNHELEMYKKMKDKNICPKLIGVSKNSLGTFIILEKMERFTHHIFKTDEMRWMRRIVSKFMRMQTLGLIHRDMKMENLLFKDGDVFFCDFEDKGYSTRWAPWEVIDHGEFSFSSDIYSLGCLFVELLSGKDPWDSDYEIEIEKNDFSELLDPIKEHKAFDFVKNCIISRCVSELE